MDQYEKCIVQLLCEKDRQFEHGLHSAFQEHFIKTRLPISFAEKYVIAKESLIEKNIIKEINNNGRITIALVDRNYCNLQ